MRVCSHCIFWVGIATSLALSIFSGNDLNEAMGVPFFYGVIEAVFVGTFCVISWKANWTKAPPDEPLWRVLWTSYEVQWLEQQDINQIEVGVSDTDTTTETSEGNILTTYFNLSWLDPTATHNGDGKDTSLQQTETNKRKSECV